VKVDEGIASALAEEESRLIAAARQNRASASHRIDLTKLLGDESFNPWRIRSVRVNGDDSATLVVDLHSARRGPTTLLLEISSAPELKSAAFVPFEEEIAPPNAGEAISIPAGVITRVEGQ
jgi:hypothetical protein